MSLLYCGGIVFTFLIEKYIAGDIIAHFIAVELIMTKFVAFFCVVVEVKSINESYESVTGKNILAAMRRFVTRSKAELLGLLGIPAEAVVDGRDSEEVLAFAKQSTSLRLGGDAAQVGVFDR